VLFCLGRRDSQGGRQEELGTVYWEWKESFTLTGEWGGCQEKVRVRESEKHVSRKSEGWRARF